MITGHKPLTWIFSVNNSGSRLIRWRLKLKEYDYVILHKSGRANANTNALSRNVIATVNVMSEEREELEENTNVSIKVYNVKGHEGIDRTLKKI